MINPIRLESGQSLAIFGGGAVGLSALLAALDRGAGAVIVVEPVAAIDPTGIDDVAEEVRNLGGGGVTHALDTTGIPAVVATAAATLRATGTLCTAGIPSMDTMLPVNMLDLMMRGIAVRGNSVGDGDPQRLIPEMVKMFLAGRLPIDRLIKTFPFEKINEAFAASKNGSAVKTVLTYGG